MAEYIERDKAIQVFLESCNEVMKEILGHGLTHIHGIEIVEKTENIPAADVVGVVHARFEWGFQNGQYGIWCTHCGAGWVNSRNAEWIAQEHNYCPKCGAKIDAKGDADNG